METESHFVPQSFSVVGKINITLAGTDDDQEDCILAIELIQNIKPDEEEKSECINPWKDVVCLQVDINELYCTLRWKQVQGAQRMIYLSFFHFFMSNKVTSVQPLHLV